MTNKAPNRIPAEQWLNRAAALELALSGKERVMAHQATEMFLLYNDRFRPEEYSRHCPKCVARVWKRVLGELKINRDRDAISEG